MSQDQEIGSIYVRPAVTERVELALFTENAEQVALCRDYWETDGQGRYRYTVKVLGARYDVSPSRVSQTIASLSEARSSTITCETCGNGFIVRSRQHLLDLHQSSWRQGRECERCQEAREQARFEMQRQRETDRRLYLEDEFAIGDENPIALDELTLAEGVSLLALIRSPEHFATDAILPLVSREERFAPTQDFGIELVKFLFSRGLIKIHPQSSLDAFVWEEDGSKSFYLDRASWVLRGQGSPDERVLDLERRLAMVYRDNDWPPDWQEQWLELWMQIAVEECIAHIQFCLSEHDFPFAAGVKTRGTYVDLLETFSIGQIYNFNWRASKDAAAYWLRAEITKHQAANSCVGNIQKQADRARAEAWDVNSFSRLRQLPVSTVSHIFFTVVMKIPDMMNEVLTHRSSSAS